MNKKCSKCKQEKNITEFYKQSNGKDGLQAHCKKCDDNRKIEYNRQRSKLKGKKERQLTLVARELRKNNQKYCPRCKQIKDLSSFYTSKGSYDGFACHCIICSSELNKNRPKSEKKDYYQKNKKELRNKHLQLRFNITRKEYYNILKQQNYVCDICGKKENNKSLAVDHNHINGKVRGLLCSRCNIALGFIKDDINIAKKLIKYLEKHKDKEI